MKKKVRQQEFGFVNWGGKRRGAGRKPNGERAGVSHAKRPRLPRLSRAMNGLATRIARGLNRLWRRVGQVFVERYHALQLTTPRAVRNALVYTLQNARKHGAWRAFAPDVYSSAPFFDGWNCPVRKGANPRPGLLERARTWLLSVGWRRHGLIDPLELPVGAEVWVLGIPR